MLNLGANMALSSMDGVTHVNVYSNGKTELGRKLSNFAIVNLPIDGIVFKTLEHYYQWLKLSMMGEERGCSMVLGAKSPFDAKIIGAMFNGEETVRVVTSETFRQKFCHALTLRLENESELAECYNRSPKTLKHYMVRSNGHVLDLTGDYAWMLEHIHNELMKGS